MPIYEYLCDGCGGGFERLVKINAAMPICPSCGGGVRKKVSLTGFRLKGSGWYKDHYGLKTESSSKKNET